VKPVIIKCPSFCVIRYILRCSARNMESELVLPTKRNSVEVSWKMGNASGNLTRTEADQVE